MHMIYAHDQSMHIKNDIVGVCYNQNWNVPISNLSDTPVHPLGLNTVVRFTENKDHNVTVMNIECVGILLHQWSKVGFRGTKNLVLKLSFYLKSIDMGTLVFIHMETWPNYNVSLHSVVSASISIDWLLHEGNTGI